MTLLSLQSPKSQLVSSTILSTGFGVEQTVTTLFVSVSLCVYACVRVCVCEQ